MAFTFKVLKNSLLVFDSLDLCDAVMNELNSTCEGQVNTNMVLQNATF